MRKFCELFGWKINSNNPMKYGIVDTGDGPGGINGGVASHDGSKPVLVYTQVDDLQATLDKVEKFGGKTILPPSEVPGGLNLAMFADPAGGHEARLCVKCSRDGPDPRGASRLQ